MKQALQPKLADRLSRILGMLGSDFDGERAAAGLKATQLLREAGLSWEDLIRPSAAPVPPPQPPMGFRMRAMQALARGALLTDWERGFLASIARQGRPLSPKQRSVLARIEEQLG
jgi:hypothetical protein